MKKFSFGKKLSLCFGVAAGLSVAMATVGLIYVNALGDRLENATRLTARRLELAADLKTSVFSFRLQERGMLLFSYIHSAQQVDSCRQAYDKAMDVTFARIGEIRPSLSLEKGRQLISEAEAGIQDYKTHQLEVRRLLGENKLDEATQYDKKMLVGDGGRIISAIDGFNELQHSLNQADAEAATGARWRARLLMGLCLLLCIPAGIVVAVVLRRTAAQRRGVATQLASGSREIVSASEQVAQASQGLAQGAQEQAAS